MTGAETYTAQYTQTTNSYTITSQAVADELVSLGVDRSKIEVTGVGGVAEVEPFNLNRRAIVTLK